MFPVTGIVARAKNPRLAMSLYPKYFVTHTDLIINSE